MKDKTLWYVVGKKFAPRNKQAAMIIRPALPIHHPPEFEPEPVFAKPFEQILHEEAEARRERIAIYEQEKAEREAHLNFRLKEDKEQRKMKLARRKVKVKVVKNRTAKVLRRIAIQRGLPPPTDEQICRASGAPHRASSH